MTVNFKHHDYIPPILAPSKKKMKYVTALDEVDVCYVNPGIQLNKTHASCGCLVANKFGESHIKIVTNVLVLLLLVYQFICKEIDNKTRVVRETCYSY